MKNGTIFLEGNTTTCIPKALKTHVLEQLHVYEHSTCQRTGENPHSSGRNPDAANGTDGTNARPLQTARPQPPRTSRREKQHSTFHIHRQHTQCSVKGGLFFFNVVEKRNTISLSELTQLRRSVGVRPDP